jgi:hypothetical protein
MAKKKAVKKVAVKKETPKAKTKNRIKGKKVILSV